MVIFFFFGYRPEEELVELLWQNGQVVMHNQTQRPPRKTTERFYNGDGSAVLHHVLPNKSAACDGDGGGGGAGPSSAPEQQLHIQEDEMASWLQYPIDDSFDRDFCSDLFYPPAGSCQTAAPAAEASSLFPKPKVPPIPPPDADKVAANFALFSRLAGKVPQSEPPRVSASTAREVGGEDPPVTSSSGRSGGGSGDWPSNPPAGDDRKRKREGDELEGEKEVRLLIISD